MARDTAIIGVSDHFGWAVLVTATRAGNLIDRRKLELVDEGLPKYPYHHDAQRLPLDQAVALVERVRASAERCAALGLDAIANELPVDIVGIALRECPPLPATIAERIKDYRAQNVADSVMGRQALAGAAESRGWAVHWYATKNVLAAAREVLQVKDIETHFQRVKASAGPPWRKDHKLAMAAAIAAAPGT